MGWLRIIAGELKGRRIPVPRAGPIRPTAERVREALFSILAPSLDGLRVLDAYSGTGALGFEALSRGARAVVFLEADRTAARRIREVAVRLGVANRCTVLADEVLAWLAQGSAGPFDLILADPPYASSEAERFLPLAAALLAPGGRIVLERDSRTAPLEAATGLEAYRGARYGGTRLDFYRRQRAAGGGDGRG